MMRLHEPTREDFILLRRPLLVQRQELRGAVGVLGDETRKAVPIALEPEA